MLNLGHLLPKRIAVRKWKAGKYPTEYREFIMNAQPCAQLTVPRLVPKIRKRNTQRELVTARPTDGAQAYAQARADKTQGECVCMLRLFPNLCLSS